MRKTTREFHNCGRCNRNYSGVQIRECPHPQVNKTLGKYICYYCCRKCKHHTKHPLCGAIGCDYHNSEN